MNLNDLIINALPRYRYMYQVFIMKGITVYSFYFTVKLDYKPKTLELTLGI